MLIIVASMENYQKIVVNPKYDGAKNQTWPPTTMTTITTFSQFIHIWHVVYQFQHFWGQ